MDQRCDELLHENNFININLTNSKFMLRNVQRYLKKLNYKRGDPKSDSLSNQHLLLRDQYLATIIENRTSATENKHRMVYIDESFIHQNYKSHHESLFHNEMKFINKRKYKGRRLCFIAGILGPDLNIEDEKRTLEQKAQFMEDTLTVYEGGTKKIITHNSIMICLWIGLKINYSKN